MRPADTIATVTAGLMWQPEIGPIPYAIMVTASPNEKAIPRISTKVRPSTLPVAAAPQPTSTSTAVPSASAAYFFMLLRCSSMPAPSSNGGNIRANRASAHLLWYDYPPPARGNAPPRKESPMDLTQQFLAWVDERPRTRADVMDAWRSSCPRLTIWEDAVIAGLVRLEGRSVLLTPAGR